MFSECPSFFLLFVYNDGALNLRLHVVALPVSVTMSSPAKSTKNLHMSGQDFLALVLQSSNSFNLNAFFNFSAVYFLLVTRSVVNCCIYGPCVPRGCLVYARIFFRLKSSNCFPVKTHVFGMSFIFSNFCL